MRSESSSAHGIARDYDERDHVMVAPAIRTGETLLVERARRGDREAFADLVDGRLAATFRTATATSAMRADARDATQDIFLRAWRNCRTFVNQITFQPGSAGPSSTRVAPRSADAGAGSSGCLGRGPARRRRAVAIPGQPARRPYRRPRPLERALDRLSLADRTLFALHHFEHLPLGDIGERLGLPGKTVKSRLFSARRSLERALEVERR